MNVDANCICKVKSAEVYINGADTFFFSFGVLKHPTVYSFKCLQFLFTAHLNNEQRFTIYVLHGGTFYFCFFWGDCQLGYTIQYISSNNF